MDRRQRVEKLKQLLKERILVLDGAMGSAIQCFTLTADDFGGPDLEGCNENLVLTRPDIISSIHESHLKAGCDIVETNTFGGTPLVLDEFGLGSKTTEINAAAVKIARKMADRYSTPEKPRFVAGSIGPTTKAITVTGGATFAEMEQHFYAQAKALFDAGADYFLVETCQDTRNVKAAFLGIDRVFDEAGESIPVALSVTIEATGTMLAGQTIEALMASVAQKDLLYLGLNCATGPEFMTDPIRNLAALSPFPVACVPNAGLPDENGCYLETPEMLAKVMERFASNGWLNVIGGCCGTHAGHIEALAKLAENAKPHVPNPPVRSFVSGIDYLEITDEMRPIIVGERTNVIGSKKFKKLICQDNFEEAAEVARAQIKKGAQIIDLCLANPDRDEVQDMEKFLERVIRKVRVPLMIDSTDEKVIELGLTYSQGKAIINSVNLEDGEERFEKVLPMVKKYGAAVVVGTIDEDPVQGMGITRERKLEIAEREFDLITKKYGIPAEDIYWDALTFPCATGEKQYVGSALETIEAIRLLKERFPGTKTVLGVSNVSFGLPNEGREALNTIFLYHCVKAGLDLAIVNSEKLERYAELTDEERTLGENLLFNHGADPIAEFAAYFRSKKPKTRIETDLLPLPERLARYVLEGTKDGLVADLDAALKTMKPLDVINGPLMSGMDQVGKLFNANQLIVAEVLQSAEVMKASVGHLEKFMEKADTASRGKVLLATVKGDVHDIGKNLVEIILANNGFSVINLGIKVAPEILIQAIREHKPDIVGLSGLLVKSAQQMVITADDMTRAGCTPPMLVGGAALTENFVDKQISAAYGGTVAYAKDAMFGLELAKRIVDAGEFEKLKTDLAERRARKKLMVAPAIVSTVAKEERSASIAVLEKLPPPPDFNRHVIKNTPIDQIWKFMNPMMLYGRHLGLKGQIARKIGEATELTIHKIASAEPKAISLWKEVEEIKNRYRKTEVLHPSAVYRFFPAGSRGNRLYIASDDKVMEFNFPRQNRAPGLCLADFAAPVEFTGALPAVQDLKDNVAMFVVSVGTGVRETSEELKNEGLYLKSHILQALALESAEAYAEWLHSFIRAMWGTPDPVETTMLERFQAKYSGKRYSFGYPACPDLADQAPLFACLQPEELGIQLTEGFMMDPEASVSAIVFHHPQASYFSVVAGNAGSEETFERPAFAERLPSVAAQSAP